MIDRLVSALFKFGLGSVVDRTLEFMERRASEQTGRERIRADVEIQHIRAAVDDIRIMADLQKAKYAVPWFWIFASLFVGPLALWWSAVVLDSIFLFSWNVAALPKPLDEWAAQIVGWLFFVGGGAAFLRGR